jgi:hypothetical protein
MAVINLFAARDSEGVAIASVDTDDGGGGGVPSKALRRPMNSRDGTPSCLFPVLSLWAFGRSAFVALMRK